jgi:hypothetical protein
MREYGDIGKGGDTARGKESKSPTAQSKGHIMISHTNSYQQKDTNIQRIHKSNPDRKITKEIKKQKQNRNQNIKLKAGYHLLKKPNRSKKPTKTNKKQETPA